MSETNQAYKANKAIHRLNTVIYRLKHCSVMGVEVDLTHDVDILENEVLPAFVELIGRIPKIKAGE